MRWSRTARARSLAAAIEEERAFYAAPRGAADVDAWQLERWNETWAGIRRDVPYWRGLADAGRVPERFGSWGEVSAALPPVDRRLVHERGAALWDAARPADGWRATGGSTSEPVRFPVRTEEIAATKAAMWRARSWFGIEPDDPAYLLWGHAHLLGSGWRGRLAAWKRRAADRLLGYRRHSAYDLSEPGLREAGAALLDHAPAWVLGYSVALDRLARVNADRAADFAALGLKAVIATAEAFPAPDSAGAVAETLGGPVAMEYGAVETGPLAHERPGGGYDAFWRHYRLEGEPSDDVEGAVELLVTALTPRAFPLVRYRLGDLVVPDAERPVALGFRRVVGRCNDVIDLPGGGAVHSEAFSHAIRDAAEVTGFEVVQKADGALTVSYTGDALGTAAESGVRERLGRIDPALAGIALERVDRLEPTVAGKTRRIRREG